MTTSRFRFSYLLLALGAMVYAGGCAPQGTATADADTETSESAATDTTPADSAETAESSPTDLGIDLNNVEEEVVEDEVIVEPSFDEEEMAESAPVEAPAAEEESSPEPAASETGSTDSEATEEEMKEEAKPADPEPAASDVEDFSPEDIEETETMEVTLGDPSLTAGIPGEGPLSIEEIRGWLDDESNHVPLKVNLPMGLAAGAGQIKGLEENPLTLAKIELGRQLYFDPRLSSDSSISCATCHDPAQGYATHTQFGIGIESQEGDRNSPVSYNRILSDEQFWDGRAASLEEQAVGPIANPIEMGHTHDACEICLKGIEGYALQFDRIFGDLNIDNVGKALASFERAIVTGPSPYDYHEQLQQFAGLDPEDLKEDDPELYELYESAQAAADEHPMSESAQRGYEIYFNKGAKKGHCSACHVGPNLTDESYHNLGVGMLSDTPPEGRAAVTKDPKDRGAFKTPTIRNVEYSAPYMHDGSEATLEDVVDYYVEIGKGGPDKYPNLSEKIKPLDDLNDQDKKDLVEFMKACSGDFPVVERGRLPQ